LLLFDRGLKKTVIFAVLVNRMMSKKFDALLAASFFLGSIAAANLHGQTLDLTTLAEKTRPSVFLITTADRNGGSIAAGTVFLVSKDGYLVTNHHVIRKAASAVAKADNGRLFGWKVSSPLMCSATLPC